MEVAFCNLPTLHQQIEHTWVANLDTIDLLPLNHHPKDKTLKQPFLRSFFSLDKKKNRQQSF
jgi:hypothetical protein